MQGRTHIVLGVAAALLVSRPLTVPGLLTAVTCGAVGGWVVDADFETREMPGKEAALGLTAIGALLALDGCVGEGLCHAAVQHWGMTSLGALAVLLLWGVLSHLTRHRSFSHSLLGMAMLCSAGYLLCPPAALPLAAGYASHLLADLCNRRGLRLLFPHP